MVCCAFIFICLIIFYFLFELFLMHKSVLFKLHIFVNFPFISLLLISSFIPLSMVKILGMILIFLYLIRLGYLPKCDLSRKYYMGTLKECAFCCCWVECSEYLCQVHLVNSIVNVHCFFIAVLTRHYIHWWIWDIDVSYYYCIVIHFSSDMLMFPLDI